MNIHMETLVLKPDWFALVMHFMLVIFCLPTVVTGWDRNTWNETLGPMRFSTYLYNVPEGPWVLLDERPRTLGPPPANRYVEYVKVVISYQPQVDLNETEQRSFYYNTRVWFTADAFRATVPTNPERQFRQQGDLGNRCPRGACSTISECAALYTCLHRVGSYMDEEFTFWQRDFQGCWYELGQQDVELQCAFKVAEISRTRGDTNSACSIRKRWRLTPQNWYDANTEQNLQTFITGGADTLGFWWEPWNRNKPFTDALGLKLVNDPSDFYCRLENPCAYAILCSTVGSRNGFGQHRGVQQTRWGYFVLQSVKHIHLQLVNHYQALQSAGIKGVLATFNIDEYAPDLEREDSFKDLLKGLASGFAIVGGFTQSALAEGLADVIGGISGFFEDYVSRQDLPPSIQAQKQFAPYLQYVYGAFEEALESITTALFNGTQIEVNQRSFNLTDMMKGGDWLDYVAIEQLTVVEERIRVEILSRSINYFWRMPANSTHNKLWVTFFNLNDDADQSACLKDISGPQLLKYCADGGVYYGYNFLEQGDHIGVLGYPWGADKLDRISITPNWTTQASARTYQVLKANGSDPFNYDDISLLEITMNTPSDASSLDLRKLYGRLPGSWTLPVCDISGYGKEWNVDYANGEPQPVQNLAMIGGFGPTKLPHPPCMCGPNGSETLGWARAAGMTNFDTFYDRCKHALLREGFVWPEGVTGVDYGFREPIRRPGT